MKAVLRMKPHSVAQAIPVGRWGSGNLPESLPSGVAVSLGEDVGDGRGVFEEDKGDPADGDDGDQRGRDGFGQ